MRIQGLSDVTLAGIGSHTIYLAGNRGEQIQLSVLDHDLFRMQVRPDGIYRLDRTWMIVDKTGDTPLEGRKRANISHFPCPEFSVQQFTNKLTVRTDMMQATVRLNELGMQWQTLDEKVFAADTTVSAYAYNPSGRDVYHHMAYDANDCYYGFGEKAGNLNKNMMRLEMRNMDAIGYDARKSDPLYKHWSFYITLNPETNIAYGILYDNLATTVFNMGLERHAMYGEYRQYHAYDGDIDYYFIYGPSVAEVVQKVSRLIGRMPMPPRWSLGYLGSTMTYTEMPDAQDQLLSFIDKCDYYDIPCDLFHLSSGYTTGETDGRRYTFNWNRKRIPDPEMMIDEFHEAGIKLAANIKPYMMQTHPDYDTVTQHDGFIQHADYDTPAMDYVWGSDFNYSKEGSHLDFTNPKTYAWWQQMAIQELLERGIDALWNDNNEFALWDDAARCNGFGDEIPLGMARPLQTLLMTRASTEAQQAHQPTKRPFVLTRAAMPGSQRYAQTWSGDNVTNWETLKYNIPMGLGLSLSGMANVGHDVGGFAGSAPSPELLVRWVQNGIFHPRFCIHSLNDSLSATEPWMYEEVLPLIQQAIAFRYQIQPYLYSVFYEAHQTGAPIIRPMIYHFQNDPNTRGQSFDFMLGSQLLVASVYEQGSNKRDLYLPRGSRWMDMYTDIWHRGGHIVTLYAPIERFPVLMKSNAILPLQTPDSIRFIALAPVDTDHESSFTLIEDDGISLGYQNGQVTKIHMTLITSPKTIDLYVDVEGAYQLPYAYLEFGLPDNEKRSLTVHYRGEHEVTKRLYL
ncbi:MAG: TIM-barrel domain-containing protein [Phototrophicaceae bacterium]